MSLEDVVLDATLGAEFLGTQQTAVLPPPGGPPVRHMAVQPPEVGPHPWPLEDQKFPDAVGTPTLVRFVWMGAHWVGFTDPQGCCDGTARCPGCRSTARVARGRCSREESQPIAEGVRSAPTLGRPPTYIGTDEEPINRTNHD